ncbi:aldo/keto reductase [Streptomyces sp. NBC_00249]|uniref:aldo/keto reductase n=1 Tax=Streptomyces sp. NBC_00249 TaxID=2975690 RepID=UPI00225B05C3|nr:aldo/keto reductase [Streptomyces sp. NBC_00249]MCX5196400.1 aldo/keto reductase [Streptomyces sp. NBC_00249]
MHGADPRLVLGLHRSRHHRDILTAALDLGVTALDTAAPYLGFRSHTVLAETAADLLPKFAVSTKVGFFPGAGGAEHSLDPSRLRLAIEKAARELGREPDTVLLHNPERSLTSLSPADGHALLGSACTTLVDAARDGLCRTWGVSSWDTRPLGMVGVDDLPSPDILMVRAGFLVGIDLLDATAVLRSVWQAGETWGMSPFGGGNGKVWEDFDPRPFLRPPHDGLSRVQAAFRTAFHLPSAAAVATGTDNPGHLAELVQALGADVDTTAVSQYLRALHGHRQS